ncbi:MAG: alanine racemase [Luminiphilus sp.]|nr:alanine racemase [Luminiphilus sp.]MDG1460746.1 alanine racemase [Luminiphilus sp.]
MDSGPIAVRTPSFQRLRGNVPRPTTIAIDLDALSLNAAATGSLAGNSRILASVKANAYGHGMIRCSQKLSEIVDGFAVAFCEEAVALREAGIDLPMLLLEGPFDRCDVDAIHEHGLMMTLHSHHQIDLLEQSCHPLTAPIWIKIDSGMHRLGFCPAEAPQIEKRLRELGAQSITLISHYADGEHPHSALTQEQQKVWQRLKNTTLSQTSMANSAGVINGLDTRSNWVRPGIMLYGAAHVATETPISLEPVMSFNSEVMALREITAGESVGYGGRWRATRDSLIATIPAGYGDGYPRTAIDGTPVWLQGRRFPLVGRVSMDMITVDVTDFSDCQVGAPVELWGKHLAVNEVAEYAATIGYELLTRMTGRAPMNFVP